MDLLGTTGTFPRRDEKCELDHLTTQGGGPVATALVALQRWGATCTFTGVVGDDVASGDIRQSLETEGIDCTDLLVRPDSDSQFSFVLAEPGCGHRTIFWHRSTGKPVNPDELDLAKLRRSRVFHTDGLMIEAALHAAQTAQAAAIPVVVDASTLRERMLDLAATSDHFIASEKFGRALIDRDSPEEACRKLAELGPKVTAVTLGARGYLACIEGEIITRPAYPVEAVDTTGCGDIFHAGFIHGLLRNWDYPRCLDYGAWAAARCATRLGGRAGIPDADEFVKTHGFRELRETNSGGAG